MTTFGEMLRYVRRRAQLTQRELGIAVGYSEGHINRFEKNKHLPDPATVAALFVPALGLSGEPKLVARLIELASPQPAPAPAPTPAGDRIPAPAPREIERAALLGRLRTALMEERCVALCGLPGVGKTTLAGALARTQDLPVFWLTLTAHITASADVILRSLLSFLSERGDESLRPYAAIGPGVRRELTPKRLAPLIARALVRQPALICLDNAELIRGDEACLNVLEHLITSTSARFLLTTRESLPLSGMAEVTIVGFEPEEALDLIRENVGRALTQAQAERLLEKTAGNPMFLRLALGKLGEEPANVERTLTNLETQPKIAAYLLRTLRERLSPASWWLLSLLSVFDQPVDLHDAALQATVRAIGEGDTHGDAVRELQRRQLVDDAAAARLHPLVRDYVYRGLAEEPTRAQRLHRLAGDWLLHDRQDPCEAARHYGQAGLLEPALDAVDEHVNQIVTRGQAVQAVAVLDHIHSQLKRLRTPTSDQRRRLLVLRSGLLTGTLRVGESETDLREALALTEAPALRGALIASLAEVINQRSRFAETLDWVEPALAALGPDDRLLRARLRSLASVAYSGIGQNAAAIHAADDALALTDQIDALPASVTGLIRARAYGELADDARNRRDLTTAMHHARAAMDAAQASGVTRAYCLYQAFVGGLFYDLGNLNASFQYRQESLQGLLALGDVHSAAYILTYLADIHHLRLEHEPAIEKLKRASDILRTVDDLRGLASAESSRASALLWAGQVEAAREVIEQALIETEGKATERFWGYRLNKRAMVLLVQGETSEALTTLKQALALAAVGDNAMLRFELHTTLGLGHLAIGDPQAAADALGAAPRLEGLSRWAEFDRELAAGYLALMTGQTGEAQAQSARLTSRVETFPLYRETTRRLQEATRLSISRVRIPARLWVGNSD